MARGKFRRGGGGGKGRGGGRGGAKRAEYTRDDRVSFENLDKTNQKFEGYYNQVLDLPEEEREDFWAALRRELPNSFRFAGSKGHALAVQKKLREKYIPEITSIAHNDGTFVDPPLPVPFYPDELAWWMTTPKSVIRRFPPFANFQKFLVSETSVGNISRQEVVSMIPPLLIDIQPGMVVLDMCAAPGSKAAQLLEMVHQGEEARVRATLRAHAKEDGREVSPGLIDDKEANLELDPSDSGRTTGLLIANDSDYKRSHMLIHQLKRLSSPNLIVTNHDATMFPSIKLPSTPEQPSNNRYLKFDRILADVPCSGDGTIRKNPAIWKDWNPGNALGLYVTQVRILVRALQMLKPGGRVVYSTCSMNPIENEAIIASAIARCGGLDKVELVDCSDRLPDLKRKPGLKNWSVIDKSGAIWKDWASVQEANAKDEDFARARLVEGMFPPKEDLPLERCMRVYSYQQDTGGFFITVLQKKVEFKAQPESEAKKTAPKPSIISIVDEIEAQTAPKEGENVAPKIESADLLTGTDTAEEARPTPVARQNQPDAVADGKRKAEDDADIDDAQQAKKLRVREDAEDAPAPSGEESRRVHYPPPPGAELDVATRPGDIRSGNNDNKPRGGRQQFEEPFKYISPTHPEIESIVNFYKLSSRFPRTRFLVRNPGAEPVKTIYYTSQLIRDILTENEGKGIKFVHGGVKMFMKQDVQGADICKWRIQSEGLPILEGYVGEERVLRLYKKETLKRLLLEMFPKVGTNGSSELSEIKERVDSIGQGCCVLRIEPSTAEDGFDERIVLPLWKSAYSINLMLAKEDRSAMLLRIYDDTTPLINNQNNNNNNGNKSNLAPGFKVENGEVHVDVDSNDAIENAAPVKDEMEDVSMKPGPYGTIVQSEENVGYEGKDVKAQKIERGQETGGSEEQLGGTGGVDGEIGQTS